MRPELTKRTLERTIKWPGLRKLIVVVDGLRSGASEIEKIWREHTIEVVDKFNEPDKLEFWCYTDNVGITEHYLRLQKRVMDEDSKTIWIEEDIDLDFEGFVNLNSNFHYANGPVLVSGYSHFNHIDIDANSLKGNLFVPMWGLRMNEDFHELICKVWRDKNFDEKYVDSALSGVFPRKTMKQRLYLKRVTKYWKEYSRWGLVSSSRWDSLANYSLWTVDRFSLSSMNRLAEDSSYLDFRGMNQRKRPIEVLTHVPTFKESGGIKFCIECESVGSRISPLVRKRIFNTLSYRLRHCV
jgi:hypothetical protein